MLPGNWRFAALVCLVLSACGRLSVPGPPLTPHQPDDFTEVPYPPPAALAETVPAPPHDNAVWVDGEWEFDGRAYLWKRGGWFVVPTGARLAPWDFRFQSDGRLMFAPGTWYDSQGRRIERPEAAVPATTPPNELTAEPPASL